MRNFDKTWIKLPRSFTSWRWYHESKMVHLFLYLLLQANVKKKDYLSILGRLLQVLCKLLKIQDCPLEMCEPALKSYPPQRISRSRAATREQLFPYVILNVSCSFLMKMILWAGLNSTAKSCLGSGIKMKKRCIFSSICC